MSWDGSGSISRICLTRTCISMHILRCAAPWMLSTVTGAHSTIVA